jgi:hypothetical protein
MSSSLAIAIRPHADRRVRFDPTELNAFVGDQIFWINEYSQAHWLGLVQAELAANYVRTVYSARS